VSGRGHGAHAPWEKQISPRKADMYCGKNPRVEREAKRGERERKKKKERGEKRKRREKKKRGRKEEGRAHHHKKQKKRTKKPHLSSPNSTKMVPCWRQSHPAKKKNEIARSNG